MSAHRRPARPANVAEIQAGGGGALAIQADAADADQLRRAAERALDELGPVDVLVNNAGVFIAGDLAQASLDDYERTMAVNVRAPFVAVQALQPSMPNGGRIINIGSCLAERAGRAGVTIYAASKSALLGLTRGLARDLGPRGITVNGAPGADRHRHEPGRRRARRRHGGGAVLAALW